MSIESGDSLVMLKKALLLCYIMMLTAKLSAQTCTATGQTPASALLVCGSASIAMTTPATCGQTNIPTPCTDQGVYQNSNPNWLRFACYQSGTLGFTISPGDANANYNWQLFDITNRNPEDVFTVASTFVACNWSSEVGETGASAAETEPVVCSGAGQPLFSRMPDIVMGRTYILLVSNQSSSPSGYQITFDGGTASITDEVEPHLEGTRAICNAIQVMVRLNKQMLCGSIAPDGSDFTISGATIIGAVPGDCTNPAGSDSIILTLNAPLAVGNYTLTIATGTDNNSLLDVCNRQLPPGESLPLIVSPLAPTNLDSIAPIACGPGQLEIVMRKPVYCNSVAPDGSDFQITGAQAGLSIIGATTSCATNGTVRIIRLQLSAPIGDAGTYTVQLITGTDGNTLVDECMMVSPPGSSVSFNANDTVSAAFTYVIAPSCQRNSVSFFHDGDNGVNDWRWSFGTSQVSTMSNPVVDFTIAGQYSIQLTVSNGFCQHTATQSITLDQLLDVSFEAPGLVCPGDPASFTNTSTGTVDTWEWRFGNNVTSNDRQPPPQFYQPASGETFYTVRLIGSNSTLNCTDTAIRTIRVPASCFIAVPRAFTPNNDGRNDFIYPLNGFGAADMEFRVYDRYGQLVFISRDWSRKWDGTINGVAQATGVYVWTLSYKSPQADQRIFMKGTTVLIR